MEAIATGIEAFLHYVMTGLADTPSAVSVSRRHDKGALIFDLHADEDDVPLLIGKSGVTVTAMRGLAQAAGALHGMKVGVEIAD